MYNSRGSLRGRTYSNSEPSETKYKSGHQEILLLHSLIDSSRQHKVDDTDLLQVSVAIVHDKTRGFRDW